MKGKCIRKIRVLLSALVLLALFVPWAGTAALGAGTNDDYLHAVGSKIYDASGNEVRLTGVAWFGFETGNQVYHGLWSVKMEDVLDTVANQGFNVVRVPLCVQLVNQWRNGSGGEPNSVNYSANPDLQGMSSLQILDASIAYCKKIGLKVMLDMHRVVNTQMLEGWYTTGYPAGDFEACWQWLAQHYEGDDTVIAMDLFNEPHGTPGNVNMVKWDDSSDQNNWKYEAEKVGNSVLDVNPNLLIVVEGIEATPKDGYTYAETNSANYNFNWWGGNLRQVRNHPVNLGGLQSQVVYSPHDYGPSVYAQPWFYSGFTQASLTADCWDPNWLYIATQNIAPVLVGEWGRRMDGGDNQKWMGYLSNAIAQHKLNHTFWCVNPNSGDTGGILLDDWKTVDTAKYNLIEPTLWKDGSGKYIGLDHAVNLGANGTHVGAGTTPTDNDSTISPTTVAFDKNTSKQANIAVTMTLNGNALNAIKNGSGTLISGTEYTVSGTTVTILKSYLASQSVGTVRLTFDFSAGVDPVLTVTVTDSSTTTVPVTGVTVSPTQLTVNGSTAGQITATVSPSNATNKTVTWSSSNTGVATVNSTGRVSGVANGTATITVTTRDGSYGATCVVTVTGMGGGTSTPCPSPTAATLPLVINGAGEFCRVTPGSITNINSWNMQLVEINGVAYTNTWSNKMPATINGSYYIHYVGKYPWSHLEVNGSGGATQNIAVTGVTVSPTSVSLGAGSTTTLTATVSPSNATNKSVTWASSNTGVATVSATGVVTGLSAGSATVTVTTQDGGHTATCAVTVTGTGGGTSTPCASAVSATLPLVINGAGEFCRVTSGTIANINSWNMQLVEINGVNYTNTWSSKMPATINGSFYIHYVGKYPWSHLEVNGSGGATQNVAVTGVTVSPTRASVGVGSTTTLTATVSPSNATNKSVTWASSNTSVATVGATGVVIGVSAGSTTVAVTTADGGFKAASAVTVGGGTANYTLTIAVNGNGSTSPAIGAHAYASGASVSVTATPSTGATFTGWSGAATGATNPVTITMDADKTLTANFSGGDDGLPDQCSGQCNSATPTYPTILSDGGLGNVTMYTTAPSDGGACNYGTTNVMYFAAMSVNVLPGDAQGQWKGGKICGQCAEVTALTSRGPETVVVRIMDKCPDAFCGIDLGGSAPGTIMLDGYGRYTGKWRFVSCDGHPEVSDGPPTLDVLRGSNLWWSRMHVRNAPTATDSIEWHDAAGTTHGTFPFATDPENSFEVPIDEVLQSGISSVLITVHYVDGTTGVVTLSPSQLATEFASYELN